MQDPIRAMKIYRGVNGDFSIVNLVRPELCRRLVGSVLRCG